MGDFGTRLWRKRTGGAFVRYLAAICRNELEAPMRNYLHVDVVGDLRHSEAKRWLDVLLPHG
jgi:hypothetical protein